MCLRIVSALLTSECDPCYIGASTDAVRKQNRPEGAYRIAESGQGCGFAVGVKGEAVQWGVGLSCLVLGSRCRRRRGFFVLGNNAMVGHPFFPSRADGKEKGGTLRTRWWTIATAATLVLLLAGAVQAASSAKAIYQFSFVYGVNNPSLVATMVGVVDEPNKTIFVNVPYGIAVTALKPTIYTTSTRVPTASQVSPASLAAQDFTAPVAYTVTAEDNSTQTYTVTVANALNTDKAITYFKFNNPLTNGTINEGAKTVAVNVPYGTILDCQNDPDYICTLFANVSIAGKSVSPRTGSSSVNYAVPVTYTVTASDLSTQAYTVTVTAYAQASPVWVDKAWAGSATGTEVAPGKIYGYNAFSQIKNGVTAVTPGGTVNVAAGTYKESNILVNKSLTIQGVGATRADVVVAPAAADVNADNAFTNAQNGFVIAAHGVTIKNLTINGRGNTALPDYSTKHNYRTGIVTLDASQTGGGAWNNLHVDNVVVKYAYRRGVSVFPKSVYGTIIQNSTVEYVAFNHGMYLGGQSQVLNNTVNNVFQGIVCDPDGTTPAGLIKVNGNTLTNIGNFPGCWGYPNGQPRAIQCNPTGPARAFEVKDNIISDNGLELGGGVVGVYTRLWASDSVLSGNDITLTSGVSWAGTGSQAVGMLLGWNYAEGFTVANNHVHSNKYGMGIMVFGSGSTAKPLVLEGNTITSTSSAALDTGDGTGVYIANKYLFEADTGESYVIIRNSNTISGFVRGIDVEKVSGVTQPLTVAVNWNSIDGNTMGVNASTMSPTVVDATDNYWGGTGPSGGVADPMTGKLADGTGSGVSANVHFDPWTGMSTGVVVEDPALVPGETLDNVTAGVSVENTGTGTTGVVIAEYTGPPADTPSFGAGAAYVDVQIDNPSGITALTITFDDMSAGTVIYFYRPGTGWIACSNQTQVGTTITVTVTAATTPTLLELTGTIFAEGTAKGNVNGDSVIDVLDARLCLQIATGFLAGTPVQRAAADVDNDGDVDLADAEILAQYIVGIITALPTGAE